MAMSRGNSKVAFANWKYRHYFSLIEIKGKNVYVTCTLCPGKKTLSTSASSNSNLMKHLTSTHANTTLVAAANPTPDAASLSSSQGDGATLLKQATLDFSGQQQVTKPELNTLIARYVVENMLPLSTVVSESFRAILAKIPIRGGGRGVAPCRNTFAKFIDSEYEKMNIKLKTSFEELEYISTTADIWTAHNKSYLGVTAHWINPNNMEREKAALACRRFKGHHTHDAIAVELDNIHSTYGITHKITATVTDNGSNFVKAFKRYQPLEESDSEEDNEDEVTFTDINAALHATDDNDGDVVITLPPHKRCASHTLNLISCTDVEKWLLSKSGTKAVYRSATAKCTSLWNKTSRSALATETVDELVSKKLLVPCTTRWNSFYDALARICEISMVDLNTISSKLGLAAITEREHQFLKEYCTAMKPLTVALDILQGEDNCFYGTLLPTIETLMLKTEALKSDLQILRDLPDAIVTSIKTRFADVLGNEEAILAAVTLPKFKLRWLRSQELKDKAKASLLAECRRIVLDEPQPGPSTSSHHTDSAKENDFFSFEEDEEETSSSAENQVADYIRSSAQNLNSLCEFSLIKKISLRYNAATPSSAPVERLFSLGKLVFSPKRNRLSDKRFEKLLLLRYNHWFSC
ncbi:uncharacterized protein [Paramisgurnus dabryanus]|uniref:uncharacterized protein n=2 Tax=Paramisgurnus dabryanus TaxID=90735 RepID=UPI0031F345B7